MHLILFIIFAGFCLAGAVNLLLQSHPINSALSLIVVMTSLAVLYLMLGAEFLAIAAGDCLRRSDHGALHLCGDAAERGTRGRAHGAARRRGSVGFPAVVAFLAVIATVILQAQGLGAAHLSYGLTDVKGAN